MEAIVPIMLGIFSSVVATLILLAANWLLRRKIIPWYVDTVYRGVRIDGKWQAQFPDGAKSIPDMISMSLKQSADQITGVLTITLPSNGGTRDDNDSVTGIITDGIVCLTLSPTSKHVMDPAVIMGRVFDDDSSLNILASMLYADTKEAKVKVWSDVLFVRESA